MTRAEFVQLWADEVAIGRKKNHPDIRVSEAAVARIDDERFALKMWRRQRHNFIGLTIEQGRAILRPGEKQQ